MSLDNVNVKAVGHKAIVRYTGSMENKRGNIFLAVPSSTKHICEIVNVGQKFSLSPEIQPGDLVVVALPNEEMKVRAFKTVINENGLDVDGNAVGTMSVEFFVWDNEIHGIVLGDDPQLEKEVADEPK